MTMAADAERRDEAAADGGRIERDVVRLARGETREVKRHRVCRRGPDAGHWRRPDVARRRHPDRGLEGERGRAFAQGQRGRSDAFFPFPDGLIAAAEAGATCAFSRAARCATKK